MYQNVKQKPHSQLTPMQLACLLMVGSDLGELIGVIDKRTVNSLLLKNLIEVDTQHVFAAIKTNYKRTFIGEMYIKGITAIEFYSKDKKSAILPLNDNCFYQMALCLKEKKRFFKIAYNQTMLNIILGTMFLSHVDRVWVGFGAITKALKKQNIEVSIPHLKGAMTELQRLKKIKTMPLLYDDGLFRGKGWFLVNSVFEEMKNNKVGEGKRQSL